MSIEVAGKEGIDTHIRILKESNCALAIYVSTYKLQPASVGRILLC